jgi:hypothetical protein
MEDVAIFDCHLVYFTVIWSILLPYGIFCGNLVYIFNGYVVYIFPIWYVVL